MNKFLVAVILGCALSLASAQSCNFPHEDGTEGTNNGGVLRADNSYIPDSVLVWVDVAENSKQYTDDDGKAILDKWIAASQDFNVALPAEDIFKTYQALLRADISFEAVAPSITKAELQDLITQVYTEFRDILATSDFKGINDYMIKEYPLFKAALGC